MSARRLSQPRRQSRIALPLTEFMEVEIRDLQDRKIDQQLIIEAARGALSEAGGRLDAVGIALVDDERIRDLNMRYLGREGVTDVIAFEAEKGPDGITGEVIISVDTAYRQAAELGHSADEELCVLVAHGVLHVLGYEDYDESSRAEMNRLQQEVLQRVEGWSDDDG